jgi:hypothetical protein
VILHPEYSTEVLIKSTRSLALRTASEESISSHRHVPAKYELVLMASAEGASLAV